MATGTNEAKGLDYISQAEKKLKGGGGLFSFLSGGSKIEEACELYVRAANAFKMDKKWQGAGNAFSQAAKLHLDSKNKHEAALNYIEAANCYKKADANEAINLYKKGIEIFTDMGRFSIAAKHHVTIAELYEQDIGDIEKAIQNYEQAADYYKGEETNSAANKCLMKVAHLCGQLEVYEKAADLFEQIGKSAAENSLLRYGAKEYFFKATVCHLCIDVINAYNVLKRYSDIFPAFTDSREYKLLQKIIPAAEEGNEVEFTGAITAYDEISRMEPWLTTLLLKVKKGIIGQPDNGLC